jgi:hypothetical protein
MKNIIKRILREQFDSNYLKKVSNILLQSEPPYFNLMEDHFNVTDPGDQLEVMKYIYGDDIKILYREESFHKGWYIYDSNNNQIYWETNDNSGVWEKSQYDSDGGLISWENNSGYWEKYEYDSNGNKIYHEENGGYWEKYEYDSDGNNIYYENSNGVIKDNR